MTDARENSGVSHARELRPLQPGGTIGILGGGQLGRMLAVAAAQLGLRSHIYCPDSGPAFDVATEATRAAYEDRAALEKFARSVDVVTFEFENVPVTTASILSELVPLRPGSKALEVAQDRLTEKQFISALGLPVAPFAEISGANDLDVVLTVMAAPSILKTRRLGYDGKGQVGLKPGDDSAAAMTAIGNAPAVLEQRIEFQCEISVLLARGGDGHVVFYDCPRNSHMDGILHSSIVPCGLSETVLDQARAIAGKLAAALDYTGVLAVELFYLGEDADNPLIINEFAPRVHNSGHWTLDACAISQFENHIRAVADWPLGSAERHSDAVMENLIGPEAENWLELAADSGACLHLYGKRDARIGRKMGHLTRLKVKTPG